VNMVLIKASCLLMLFLSYLDVMQYQMKTTLEISLVNLTVLSRIKYWSSVMGFNRLIMQIISPLIVSNRWYQLNSVRLNINLLISEANIESLTSSSWAIIIFASRFKTVIEDILYSNAMMMPKVTLVILRT
jgi:hypothetical protein